MPLNIDFAGKKVLITGGGQGIGRALVQRFHDDGAQVYTLDKNPETIDKLKAELPSVNAHVVDLTDWEATRKLIESFGPIDHLVNNAAIMKHVDFMDITKSDTSQHFDVNVGVAINVTQAFARPLIQAGRAGTVVNIASIAARVSGALGTSLYCASKAAVENLTRSMAVDLGIHGIRVNCVLPGIVNAPMITTDPMFSAAVPMLLETLTVKRLIEPREIVDLIMYLLSPLAEMIVGQSVVIDGGALVKN